MGGECSHVRVQTHDSDKGQIKCLPDWVPDYTRVVPDREQTAGKPSIFGSLTGAFRLFVPDREWPPLVVSPAEDDEDLLDFPHDDDYLDHYGDQ